MKKIPGKVTKLVFTTSIVLGTLFLSSGQSHAAIDKKATLNWMESSELTTMDISKTTDVVSAEALNNSNEGLLRQSKGSTVKPGVAKSYTVSKDGLTYTFNLRNSKWSDGTPVTAKDFVYSWQRTVNPKTASEYAFIFENVKNAKDIVAGKKDVSELGVKADGDNKLVVTLEKPQTYFKQLVSMPQFFPQKEAAVTKYGAKYGTNSSSMVYNGPYKLTGWTGTNSTWKLVKNNDYWDKKRVKIAGVYIRAIKDPQTALSQYQSGKLDVTNLSSNQIKNFEKNKEFVARKGANTFYIQMNEKKDPILKNEKIRKALSLTIDRNQLTKNVLQGGSVPANGLVPKGLSSYKGKDFASAAGSKTASTQNLKEAKKLWKEGLKEEGKSKVSLSLLADDTSAGKQSTEFLQSQLTKLPGLKITNQNLPFKTRLAYSSSGKFDLVISAWNADFADPINFLQLFKTNSSNNNGKWSSTTYDDLIDKAENADANDQGKRWTDMVDGQKNLLSQQGIIPLYSSVTSQLVKSKVHGIVYFPTGSNWDFSYVTIDK